MELFSLYNYWVFAVLFSIGLYAIMAQTNLVKKLIGMSIVQASVFLLYISMDKVDGGTAPIIKQSAGDVVYSNPLPQVLILTAIVVGIATLALGLAITVRISETYGTIEEDKMLKQDRE